MDMQYTHHSPHTLMRSYTVKAGRERRKHDIMALVIRRADEISVDVVPVEMLSLISAEQWHDICSVVKDAFYEGTMWACCCEITCCLCFAFPCIFLCHPCLEHSITSQRIHDKCNDINRKYFFNQPIVSYGEEGVTINYSRLEIMNQPYVSPVVVSTSPFHGQPSQKYVATAVASPAPIVTAIPVPPSPQVFQVTIPEGYTPGSHLTVSAPNGQQISVTIPPNSRPGDILNIQT